MYTLRESRRGPWRPEAQRFVVNGPNAAQLGPRLSQRSPRALVLEPTWNGMEWDGMKSNLCQILQHRSPRAVKISPGGSQNRGWGRPREPRCIQKVPKTSPEGPKRRPRGAQEAFKSAQEMSKRRLRGPRRLQTPSKIKPSKVGTRPRRVRVCSGSTWRTYPRKNRSQKSLRTSFVLFFR